MVSLKYKVLFIIIYSNYAFYNSKIVNYNLNAIDCRRGISSLTKLEECKDEKEC